ncbi:MULTISPECIES: hypothetical protein [unclassified Bradyrhizobium]|uniref:hypothetical protein n=1 Tax=unclassified Bradyrhizobium TaxID=2631580 RepID=UPI001FF8FC49|nr:MULTISPECIES: hypothetical protein [unclassified Bradyrhizobium]MCK1519552.1 hypothetical protein [Bradyrhizobium sp. 17]MCK1689382.1 hypothetical protein [Bradyrhizobium sp. 145]
MATWPKDTQASRNAFYGYPGKGEIAAQIVRPAACAMYYKGQRVKSIMFHRTAAPALRGSLNEIWDYGQHDKKRIGAAGVSNMPALTIIAWCADPRPNGQITPMPLRSI